MKNKILCSALFTLISTHIQAEAINQAIPTPQSPATTLNAVSNNQATPTTAPSINCDYKIPAETKKIDQSLVLTWTEKAVIQSFDFNAASIDLQLQKLQSCFTEQGWTGFNTALQKSGNLEAIKSQKLTVNSQVDGMVLVKEAKDNQWKLSVPLQVVYQNDKEKITQLLSVDVTVGRRITGELGITQMIAAPRGSVTTQKPDAATPNNNNTPTTPNTPIQAKTPEQPTVSGESPSTQQTSPALTNPSSK